MTNFEYYKAEILKILSEEGDTFAMVNNNILRCGDECNNCKFRTGGCISKRFKWLYEEYVEIQVLTNREWHLLKALKKGYIARDKNGKIYWHPIMPTKYGFEWESKEGLINLERISSDIFVFVKWEDAEPHSVEEMLTWEHEYEINSDNK